MLLSDVAFLHTLLYLFRSLEAVCRKQGDGTSCSMNLDCDGNMKCFFRGNSHPNRGICCAVIPGNFYNAMFVNLLEDPYGIIPEDLFLPVRDDDCMMADSCGKSEACMSSVRWNLSELYLEAEVNAGDIWKRCYKKPKHWMYHRCFPLLQFCNHDSMCSNNKCVALPKLVRTYFTYFWRPEKVRMLVTSKSVLPSIVDVTVDSAVLKLLESDVAEYDTASWKLDVNTTLFHRFGSQNWTNCVFEFPRRIYFRAPGRALRIRRVELKCDRDLNPMEVTGDIEIIGRRLTIVQKAVEYNGLCGHPGLECSDCLLNGQLFTCSDDKDCYNVGPLEWPNQNKKSFCSQETYNGGRLCKREHFTCPPDSLNRDGALPASGKRCTDDSECADMRSFATLAPVDETFYPHCFNGLCCARRLLCENSEFPYALPVVFHSIGGQRPCEKDDDCPVLRDLISTCIFHEVVTSELKRRRMAYLATTDGIKKKPYGMCCYKKITSCPDGGTPFTPEFAEGACSNHADCNPDVLPFQWTAYCSGAVPEKNGTCCRDEKSNALCPDGFTPWRNEPKCNVTTSYQGMSETCPKSNGMCYKGHCCSRQVMDKNFQSIPYASNYETEAPCNPAEVLDKIYQWAFCDENKRKIVLLGDRTGDGQLLDWKKKRCITNSDCGHMKYLCVNKIYGIRHCVVSPNYNAGGNSWELIELTSYIVALLIGIIIVIYFTPS